MTQETFETLSEITLAKECDETREYFHQFVTALQGHITELGGGRWCEPPKIVIDSDNHIIRFGYDQETVLKLFHVLFTKPLPKQLNVLGTRYQSYKDAIFHRGDSAAHKKWLDWPFRGAHSPKLLCFADVPGLQESNVALATLLKEQCQNTLLDKPATRTSYQFFSPAPETVPEFIAKLFAREEILHIGEQYHAGTPSCSFIIENIASIAAGGVRKIFLEHFYAEQQHLLDYFFLADENSIPYELESHIEELCQINGFDQYSLYELLETCKRHNIRVYGIESIASVQATKKNKHLRVYSFDFFAAEIINQNLAEGEAAVVATGLAHNSSLGTHGGIGCLLAPRSVVTLIPTRGKPGYRVSGHNIHSLQSEGGECFVETNPEVQPFVKFDLRFYHP